MEFIDNVIDSIEDVYTDTVDEEQFVAADDSGAPVPTEIEDLQNFDPSQATDVVGTPEQSMDVWHMQETDTSCAVASQEFILESFTGEDFSEAELRDEAEAAGWWTPEGGTPMDDVGKLLEEHGIETEQEYGATTDELRDHLESGDKVIVGVDSDEIWTPGTSADDDTELGDSPGMPGQDVDHAVEVTGIVQTPEGEMVVLNDPGHPDGQGSMMPIEEFESAWADSDNFAVWANNPEVPADDTDAPVTPAPVETPDVYVTPPVEQPDVYVDPSDVYVDPTIEVADRSRCRLSTSSIRSWTRSPTRPSIRRPPTTSSRRPSRSPTSSPPRSSSPTSSRSPTRPSSRRPTTSSPPRSSSPTSSPRPSTRSRRPSTSSPLRSEQEYVEPAPAEGYVEPTADEGSLEAGARNAPPAPTEDQG